MTLINLDHSKAFDRVDHGFLRSVLEGAGFNPGFHKWISTLYTRLTAVVEVNGMRSEPFIISRLVHQGCLLSPLFYVLVN